MKKDHQDQAEREFRAILLDQNHGVLATARVAVARNREGGSIYPFGDVPVSHLSRSAKFLRVKKEVPVAIYHLRVCPTSGQSHLHFSFVKLD